MKTIQSYKQLDQEFLNAEEQLSCEKDIEFIILAIKEASIYNYSKLTLLLNNEINDHFIIKPVYNIEEATKIKIKLSDIIFRTFKGKSYYEIKNVHIIKSDNKNMINTTYNTFNFSIHNYINSLSELKQIKYNSLVSIPVKIKEKETSTATSTIVFKDVNKKGLIVKLFKEKSKIEGQKIYILEGFLYNSEENKLIQLSNSNVSEVDELLNKNINITESYIPNLFNFKGKIKEFDFMKKTIYVENVENKTHYEININQELFAKISLNCDCYFYNFSRINEDEYKSNYFSNIKYLQKTYLNVNFIDDLKDKYYDLIKCDNITREINDNKILLEFDDYSNKTSEIKTITYQKKDEKNNIIDQIDFHLEINNGKKNNIDSLSTKTDGYSYQLYFESSNKNSLPKNNKKF